MSARHALLRRIYAEGPAVLADHATQDFEAGGMSTGPLRVLFPGIRHEVVELLDAEDARVVARVRVSLGEDIERTLDEALATRRRRSPPG